MGQDEHEALVVVDMQPDFMPGGGLEVERGDETIPGIRVLMRSSRLCVGTQDWHPEGHISFASSHEGRDPFDTIELYGHEQTLWPDHCIEGTPGAELHPDLPWERAAAILRKGADPRVDSYSGFHDNWNPEGERPPTGLAGYLEERGIRRVVVCGLAREICCLWTARDAAAAGFWVRFVWDLTRPVDPSTDDRVRRELEERDIEIVTAEDLA